MRSRLRTLGMLTALIGIVAMAGGAYGYYRVQNGGAALSGFSEEQGVTLSYNDDGNLVDRGTEEGAEAILDLLTDDWHWPVVESELDPDDPVIDTGTEYMYQMATIAYHVLHGSQNITLDDRAEWDGDGDGEISRNATVYSPTGLPDGVWDPEERGMDEDAIFEPGTYVVPVNGRYWTDFSRQHPLDGPTREAAWTGTVHGLFAELGVGATTASMIQLGGAVFLIALAFGLAFLIVGAGMIWVASAPATEQPA